MDENKNLIIVILFSLVVILGFEFLWNRYKKDFISEPPLQAKSESKAQKGLPSKTLVKLPREVVLKKCQRIPIHTRFYKGSICLKGLIFDDIVLKQYRETIKKESPDVELLSPKESENPYFVSFQWKGIPDEGIILPSEETIWKANGAKLTPKTSIIFTWESSQGLLFKQKVSVDGGYMFTVVQSVLNKLGYPFSICVSGEAKRIGTPATSGYMSYEGPLGVFNGKLKEVAYDKVLKDRASEMLFGESEKGAGWIGITDKYWLVALAPNAAQKAFGMFEGMHYGQTPVYQTQSVSDLQKIEIREKFETTTHLFVGAKVLRLLDAYEKKLKINHFDLAVDFGWFYFLTKPMFYLLSWLKTLCGNFGVAILVMTIMTKLLFFPLSIKSSRSMAKMKQFQPKIEELKKRYGEDKVKMNQALLELYKREKINPASGCLPMIIQIPVFFALYKVLFVSIEMRQAPFFGWIHDLSAPDPTNIFTLFGLIPWDPPSVLCIGVWPLFMGVSMLMQQRMNPSPATDPIQKNMFLYGMPVLFTYMFSQFPSGLVIYYTWSNFLTILQQWVISSYYSHEKPKKTKTKLFEKEGNKKKR